MGINVYVWILGISCFKCGAGVYGSNAIDGLAACDNYGDTQSARMLEAEYDLLVDDRDTVLWG